MSAHLTGLAALFFILHLLQAVTRLRCSELPPVETEPEMETAYREVRSSQQVRAAEDLRELPSTAGVLLVDVQGHGIIAVKIASTVYDTFHVRLRIRPESNLTTNQ